MDILLYNSVKTDSFNIKFVFVGEKRVVVMVVVIKRTIVSACGRD